MAADADMLSAPVSTPSMLYDDAAADIAGYGAIPPPAGSAGCDGAGKKDMSGGGLRRCVVTWCPGAACGAADDDSCCGSRGSGGAMAKLALLLELLLAAATTVAAPTDAESADAGGSSEADGITPVAEELAVSAARKPRWFVDSFFGFRAPVRLRGG